MKFVDEDSESLPFFAIKGGAAIFLNPNISLDLFAEYVYAWDKQEMESGSTVTDTQGMFGVGIGLSFFLSNNNISKD